MGAEEEEYMRESMRAAVEERVLALVASSSTLQTELAAAEESAATEAMADKKGRMARAELAEQICAQEELLRAHEVSVTDREAVEAQLRLEAVRAASELRRVVKLTEPEAETSSDL